MKILLIAIVFGFVFAFEGRAVFAQDLVYTPVNPSFGGNPLNSSHLLGVANAQNDYSAPPPKFDAAEQFRRQLQTRLFAAVSAKITDAIFGENAQDTGTVQFDGQTISWTRSGDQVRVVIRDDITGGETIIEVPVSISSF